LVGSKKPPTGMPQTPPISSARPPKSGGPSALDKSKMKREKSSSTRQEEEQRHLQEQQRLRQQRLQLQAEFEKKKMKGKKPEDDAEKNLSLSAGTLSSRSTCSNDEHSDGTQSNSKLTDEGPMFHESFQARRDADAEEDRGKLQKQRTDGEHAKARGNLMGRRARQSSTSAQGVKPEKTKGRGKGVRVLRRQKQTAPLPASSKVGNR